MAAPITVRRPNYDMRRNSIGLKGWVSYPPDNYLLDIGSAPADYFNQEASDGGKVGPDFAELQRRIPWYPLPPLTRAWVAELGIPQQILGDGFGDLVDCAADRIQERLRDSAVNQAIQLGRRHQNLNNKVVRFTLTETV